MTALAVAIVGATFIGLAALGVLFLTDRSGQSALRSYRHAHRRDRWLT